MTYSRLSPENLSCDGELPRSAIKGKLSRLKKDLKRLFVEFGREVDEIEAYELLKAEKYD
jgi:hypothetical protein